MARITGLTLDVHTIVTERGVQRAVERKAGEICVDANQTSAKIGITWRRTSETTVLIGPRGAAAIPVEYGTARTPARRPVKRALDRHRLN